MDIAVRLKHLQLQALFVSMCPVIKDNCATPTSGPAMHKADTHARAVYEGDRGVPPPPVHQGMRFTYPAPAVIKTPPQSERRTPGEVDCVGTHWFKEEAKKLS